MTGAQEKNQRKMDKKAIAYEFLLRLILAIVFVIGAIYIGASLGKSLFRLTDASAKSYEKLQNKIIEIGQPGNNGKKVQIGIDMDKETAIFGFSKHSQEIERLISGKNINVLCEADKTQSCRAFFKRPESCEKGKACICFCREYEIDSTGIVPLTTKMRCKLQPRCKSFDNLDLWDFYQSKHLSFYPDALTKLGEDHLISGGFIIARIDKDPNGLLIQNAMPPRTRELTIQNYNGLVAVCQLDECVNEETKKIKDIEIKRQESKNVKKAFGNFIIFLTDCKENSVKCGGRAFEKGYNIYYIPKSKSGADNGIYLLEDVGMPDVEKYGLKFEDGRLAKFGIELYWNENVEVEEGYIFKNNFAMFASKDGRIFVSN